MCGNLILLLIVSYFKFVDCVLINAVDCFFSPMTGLHTKIGELSRFNMSCHNRMWEKGYPVAIIQIYQDKAQNDYKLCVEIDDISPCVPSSDPIWLNMSVPHQIYNIQVTSFNFGIRCIRQKNYYPSGSLLLNAGYSILQLEAQGTLLQYGVDEYQNIMDLSDTYSDILIVGKQSWTNISTDEMSRTGIDNLTFTPVVHQADVQGFEAQSGGLEVQFPIFMSENISKDELEAKGFSRVMTLLALCFANFMIGTGIDESEVRGVYKDIVSSCRQLTCASSLLSLSAWKVGLMCQTVYVPLISFTLGQLIFRHDVECNMIVDLTRIGLFLLGISPGATASTYFSHIFCGDLSLSVLLVILSTILSPFTIIFWNMSLGGFLNTDTNLQPIQVPGTYILKYSAALIIPIIIGIYAGSKFTKFGEIMSVIRKPIMVVGLIGALFIYYFQYKYFFTIFSWRHFFACGVLSLGSTLAALITAHFCSLTHSQIISIGIDTGMQNSALSYFMLKGVYMNPMDDYATTPANAQIFFTSLPLMCLWFVYTIFTIFSRWRNSAKPAGPITQIPPLTVDGKPLTCVKIQEIKQCWAEHNLKPLWV